MVLGASINNKFLVIVSNNNNHTSRATIWEKDISYPNPHSNQPPLPMSFTQKRQLALDVGKTYELSSNHRIIGSNEYNLYWLLNQRSIKCLNLQTGGVEKEWKFGDKTEIISDCQYIG